MLTNSKYSNYTRVEILRSNNNRILATTLQLKSAILTSHTPLVYEILSSLIIRVFGI